MIVLGIPNFELQQPEAILMDDNSEQTAVAAVVAAVTAAGAVCTG